MLKDCRTKAATSFIAHAIVDGRDCMTDLIFADSHQCPVILVVQKGEDEVGVRQEMHDFLGASEPPSMTAMESGLLSIQLR